VQLWMFVSPVIYPIDKIPAGPLRVAFALNPMTGVVEGFRWALLGVKEAPSPMIAVSSIIAILLMVSGLFYFRRMERTFADEI